MTSGLYPTQKHSKACLPQVLSYITEIPVDRIFEIVGHDCLNGMSHSEAAAVAHYLDFTYTYLKAPVVNDQYFWLFTTMVGRSCFGALMIQTNGGMDHALAKMHHLYIDPVTGLEVDIADKVITGFAAIERKVSSNASSEKIHNEYEYVEEARNRPAFGDSAQHVDQRGAAWVARCQRRTDYGTH